MKPFSNYDDVQAYTDFEKLPNGAYEVKIKKTKVTTYKSKSSGEEYQKLEIAFDICAGDWAGYYQKDLDNQQQEDKRWKGVLRLTVPQDDGSERDEVTKRIFKAAMIAIEDSNPGYHWDWNEAGLAGKVVGMLTRWEEWAYNGKTGWTARPFKFTDIAKVREGDVKLPKDKPLPEDQKPFVPDVSAEDENEEDLPF